MALSAITLTQREHFARFVGAVVASGVSYVVWAAEDGPQRNILWWRPEAAAEGTEVRALLGARFAKFTVEDGGAGTFLVAYADSEATHANLYFARIDLATGATVAGPTRIGAGTSPAILRLHGAAATRVTVVWANLTRGAIYLRESYDGGVTWQDERAILNNKVAATAEVVVAPFDETHVSVGQVGEGARALVEVGSVSRTRPVTSVLRTADYRLLVGEAAVRTGQVNDNLRGRMVLDGAGNVLVASRARQGADDGVGDLAFYNGQGDAPSLIRSAVLAAGAAPGGEIVRAPADGSGAGATIYTTPGAEVIADLAVTAGHALFAAYGDTAGTGRAGWVDLGSLASGEFALPASGAVARAGAIAVGERSGGLGAVAVGYAADGAEWVSVANFASPPSGMVFSNRHLMPSRVNALALTLATLTSGFLYVGLTDRVNVYAYAGPTNPIRLLRSYPLLTGGEVHGLVVTASGNVVAALGVAGLAVFGPEGETLALVRASELVAMPWRAGTAYTTPTSLAQPTPQSPYAPQRRLFRCSRSGTSGTFEPNWGVTNLGHVDDPNPSGAGWQDAGPAEARVTGVAVDTTVGLIYVAAVLGGATGTQGRVYVFDTAGLVGDPPRAQAPTIRGGPLPLHTSVSPVSLELLCSTPGATIYYTTDGSAPTQASNVYTGTPLTFDLTGSYVVRCYAEAPSLRPSTRTELRFFIDLPDAEAPIADPAAGQYLGTQQVTLFTNMIGTTIRYTTDGSDPTIASPIFDPQTPLVIDRNTTVKAYSTRPVHDDSPIVTFNFVIVQTVIPFDAAAVSHLMVAGGVPLDRIGGTGWGEIGNVPANAIEAIFGKWKESLGAFSDANYLEISGSQAGSDILDVLFATQNWIATYVVRSGVGTDILFHCGISTTGGHYLTHESPTTNFGLSIYTTGTTRVEYATGPDLRDGGVHVISIGRYGAANWAFKVDGRATQTFAAPTVQGLSGARTRLGRSSNLTGRPFTGRFYEARFLGVAGDPAALDALHAAVMGV